MRMMRFLAICFVVIGSGVLVTANPASATQSTQCGSLCYGAPVNNPPTSTPEPGPAPQPQPQPPACTWSAAGNYLSLSCSPLCATAQATCATPPLPSNCVITSAIRSTVASCTPTNQPTYTISYGPGGDGSPGTACVSQLEVVYGNQTQSFGTGSCSQLGPSGPPASFRAVCTGRATSATVSYWIRLPAIQPPSNWYSQPFPAGAAGPPPWPPATATDGQSDAPGATLGPFRASVVVPPCTPPQGEAITSMSLAEIHGRGLVADTGQRYHYVIAPQICCGVNPILQLESASVTMTNRGYYHHLHQMEGMELPAWSVAFSRYNVEQTGSSGNYGWRADYASPADTMSTRYFLASQWGSDPGGPWQQVASSTPKLVFDFASHQATVRGTPYQLRVAATMKVIWTYWHFTIAPSLSCSSGQITTQVPPWGYYYTYVAGWRTTKTAHGKKIKVPIYATGTGYYDYETPFFYPSSCTAAASISDLYPGSYKHSQIVTGTLTIPVSALGIGGLPIP